jgi:hypothetical protein
MQGSHTIFNIKFQGISRIIPGIFSIFKGDFRKSLAVFFDFRMGCPSN